MNGSMSSPLGLNISCNECTDIVNVMFEVAKNATVRAALIADVNGTCLKLFPTKPHEAALCIEFGDQIVDKLLPWIDFQLETLAWDARAVCSNFVPVCKNPCCSTDTIPEMLRLSLSGIGNASNMAITWTTLKNTSTHTVQWGPASQTQEETPPRVSDLPFSSEGWSRTYTFGGWVGVVHTAVMYNLQPGTRYNYRVGDVKGGWSDIWTFSTIPSNAGTVARPLRLVQIGDMGYANKSDDTVAAIIAEIDKGNVDMVLHVGDVSYADGDMPHWDLYLRKIERIAARVPYMTNPGNHELWYNFTAYKTHFWTPASLHADHRMFYSFDFGGVHFTQMNTETITDTANMDQQQVDWLASDLAGRDKKTKFTIATGHRPFYCTNGGSKDKDCVLFTKVLRREAEQVLIAHHVDLVITAHMHGYERTWPVADGEPTAHNYALPSSPAYVVNGAGGNRESNNNPNANQPWSAGNHTASVGYARITITGASLLFEFVVSANRSVFDSFIIQK